MKTIFFIFLMIISAQAHSKKVLPFINIQVLSPDIKVEAKYFSDDNFVGEKIDGYQAGKCLLSHQAAQALARAQKIAKEKGLFLKAFDCYRPQKAVDHFVRWAKDLTDTRRKRVHYPYVSKKNLFANGYIASKSGHSRGSTIDLTLVDANGVELDMGGIYDFFDPISHTLSPQVPGPKLKNRKKLKSIMESAGFKNYSKEWWHYTLKNEPYPDSYFSFPVK